MKLAGDACRAIGKRADMFRNLISEIDPIFKPLIEKMEAVVKERGTDYPHQRGRGDGGIPCGL